MVKHTLKRDNERPVTFRGERIGEASTQSCNDTRWTDVDIYRTQAGRLIAHTSHISQWQGEGCSYHVVMADNVETLLGLLRYSDEYSDEYDAEGSDGALSDVVLDALADAGLDVAEEVA